MSYKWKEEEGQNTMSPKFVCNLVLSKLNLTRIQKLVLTESDGSSESPSSGTIHIVFPMTYFRYLQFIS